MNLNETYDHIEALLDLEEKMYISAALPNITVPLDLTAREERRKQIDAELLKLRTVMATLSRRFQRLPDLPPMYLVEWTQAVLKFQNLAFVVLDTTGVDDDSDIIRVLVANREGHTLYDHLVKPGRQQWANTVYTGIAQEQVDVAPSLADLWPFIEAELFGRYVLAYNLSFIKAHLDENAEHYGLPKITLIGEDLQEKAGLYWSGSYYRPKLAAICKRIGHELPQPATAPDRVAGQRALLLKMSQGIIDMPQEASVAFNDEDIF